jgi:murein DD-endopeptidase MepM/ murein hydrolase activator NlpD
MPTFPLPILPSQSWHNFGSERTGQYKSAHPACDLKVPAGTEIYAVADGVIIQGPYKFAEYAFNEPKCHSVTYAVEVKHEKAGFIARYCEIDLQLAIFLDVGSEVKEGQFLACVGMQCGREGPGSGSMLHFEMYKNYRNLGGLTDKNNTTYLYVPNAPYYRRSDLLDPTRYLDAWQANMPTPVEGIKI